MYWRKWLVRSLVFSMAAALASAGLAYQHWTNPSAVREQVVQRLGLVLPGANAHLEAARLRLFGGIILSDLRLIRKDDASRRDFAYVPSCTVYHDKEQLLDGQFCFRKVELHRPRLRVIREKDGRWNMVGLHQPEPPTRALPALIVQEGTILIEDRGAPDLLPIEITDVYLTVINDPLSLVTIDGGGKSAVLGCVQVHGTWRRDTDAVQLTLMVNGAPLNGSLVERLASWCPHGHLEGTAVDGRAHLQVDLKFLPGQPLDYTIRLQVERGRLRHPAIPLPLEDVKLTAQCHNGAVILESFTALSGPARIEGSGCAAFPCVEQHFQGRVLVKGLPICPELCSRLPPDAQKLHTLFQPAGPVTVELEAHKQAGEWKTRRCRLLPEQLALCFKHFRYPVRDVVGEVDIDFLKKFTTVNLRTAANPAPGKPTQPTEIVALPVSLRSPAAGQKGLSAQGPATALARLRVSESTPLQLTLQGTWSGDGLETNVDLHLTGKNIPVDSKLTAALPPDLRKLADSFNVSGIGDCTARFIRVPGQEKFRNEFHIDFRESALCWNRFPYPLEKISGQLHIYPEYWRGDNFRGVQGEGAIVVNGRSYSNGKLMAPGVEMRIGLEIIGQDIPINGKLRHALKEIPGLARAWDAFSPAGKLSFRAHIDRLPGRPEDIEIAVNVGGCSICPDFFPLQLHDLGGQFRYSKNRLELTGLHARHGLTQLAVSRGLVDLAPGGGFYADIEQLSGNPVVLEDAALLGALPLNLRTALKGLQLRDPVALQTRLIIARSDEPGAQPDLWWDGRLWLHDARLKVGVDLDRVTGVLGCRGRHNGRQFLGFQGNLLLEEALLLKQPFRQVHSHLQITAKEPDVLRLSLHAPLFGGDLSGEGRLEFHSNPRYELNLTASQIDLKQLGDHNLGQRSEWDGSGHGRLYLVGQAGVGTLDGHGSIDIPSGKLYNLPWLLDLLKFLGLRWPDRTAFDEAHANFTIQGNRVAFERLDLWGNAISMSGKGAVNLDGTDVHIDFTPSWARMEQILPPALRSVSPAVSQTLLKIEVRGKLGKNADELKFHKKPMPLLLDPLRRLREQMVILPALSPISIQAADSKQPIKN